MDRVDHAHPRQLDRGPSLNRTAWSATGTDAELWYATLDPEFHHRWGALNDEVGLWMEGSPPPCTPREELAARITLDDPILDRKIAALRAHASQTTGLIDLVGLATYREWWRTEHFVSAPTVLEHTLTSHSVARSCD